MNEAAIRASQHESIHASLAAQLRVPLLGIERSRGWEARTTVDTDVDHLAHDGEKLYDEAVRRCAVIIGPTIMRCDGIEQDVEMFAKFGRAGIRLDEPYELSSRLLTTLESFELRSLVFNTLLSRPKIVFPVSVVGADELRAALA